MFPFLILTKCRKQSLKKSFEINISGQAPKQSRSKVSIEHNTDAGVFEDLTWSHPLLQSWRPVWVILGFCTMHFYPHSPISCGRPPFFSKIRKHRTSPHCRLEINFMRCINIMVCFNIANKHWPSMNCQLRGGSCHLLDTTKMVTLF